ncbi:MAG: DUF2764 domain-containing protein [Spirochaetaceae bacterium]|jgi:hypothetical protein|nr:DUF2764 domain-containing protein [Spirochaetaceae bacterium]
MSSYYYLVAQLPYLVYGQGTPMSSGDFRSLAGEKLAAADAALLDFCVLDPARAPPLKPGSVFLGRWLEWEMTLRLNLAQYRAQKLRREFSLDVPQYPSDAAALAKAALSMDAPLEAELFLDKARWGAIESFEGIDYFNRNRIYAYLLKLLLLERHGLFRAEEGFAEYRTIYASIMNAAPLGAAGLGAISTESGEAT